MAYAIIDFFFFLWVSFSVILSLLIFRSVSIFQEKVTFSEFEAPIAIFCIFVLYVPFFKLRFIFALFTWLV